jgi:hypothetical protein
MPCWSIWQLGWLKPDTADISTNNLNEQKSTPLFEENPFNFSKNQS